MPYVRPALVEMLTTGTDPYEAILQWCTTNSIPLAQTPIIIIDLDSTNQPRGRQLVFSIPREHPWGITPRCGKRGDPKCQSRPGDVYGVATKSNDTHSSMIFFCKRCKHCRKVQRPGWITHAHKHRPYYFVMRWPLSDAQLCEIAGLDKDWEPTTGKMGQ